MTGDDQASGEQTPDFLQILQLEDCASDRDLIQEKLRTSELACRFHAVTTRQEFAAALRHGGIDLILADYTLPDFNGAAALALAREVRPDTPFIFISGTIGEERAIATLKNGATDYVLKNQMERLVPAVNRALKEAAEQRGRSLAEQRFQEMAANIREVFWSASADGRTIFYISPAYERVWERSVAELMRRPETWLHAILPEDRERVRLARDQLGQGKSCTLEYRITRPDGGTRWIEEHAYPVTDDRGVVVRSAGVALDISTRRSLEEELQQTQKIDMIGQLAGGIAHDFGNLFTVINGYSNLLLDNPAVPAEIVDPLRQIFVAGGRAAALTRQLLLFSGKSELQFQSLDLNAVVTESAGTLRRMIGENIRFEFDLAQPLPRTVAEAGMIEQVLMNLAVNARDAMPHGGDLLISTGSCELTDADEKRAPDARAGAFVWLGVRDTGSGISPDILPRIFEPLFTTKEPGQGLRLGLATVFGIARQHQGWMEVESEAGIGTLFRLLLPIAKEEPAPATPEMAASPARQGTSEVILLVEDEDIVREFARALLETRGYRVLQATTGAEAMEVWTWHRARIELLLTDVVLPHDMTGLALAERLWADRQDLPVLFCSGHTENIVAEEAKAGRRFGFLQKPYSPQGLVRAVRETIDASNACAGKPVPSSA